MRQHTNTNLIKHCVSIEITQKYTKFIFKKILQKSKIAWVRPMHLGGLGGLNCALWGGSHASGASFLHNFANLFAKLRQICKIRVPKKRKELNSGSFPAVAVALHAVSVFARLFLRTPCFGKSDQYQYWAPILCTFCTFFGNFGVKFAGISQ